MALTEAQRRANDKYIAANYKRVTLSMPNAEADRLTAYCKAKQISKAGFIRQLITNAINNDSSFDG